MIEMSYCQLFLAVYCLTVSGISAGGGVYVPEFWLVHGLTPHYF